jgi:uncharacterized protein (TIGR03083 family)
VDLTSRDLVEIGFDALEAATDEFRTSPGPLGSRVLAAARQSDRPVQHPAWAATAHKGLTPLAAFTRTAAELGELLAELTAEEWERELPIPGGTARDLIRHLTGIERYVLGQLGRGDAVEAPRREDHYPVSRRLTSDLEEASPDLLARAWWLAVLSVISASGELGPGEPVAFHHLPGTLRGLLVVRTFELWTHSDDIRRGMGRRLSGLDGARLALMSAQLMEVLGLGMALSGTPRSGRTARIVLTGPGDGQFDVALGPEEQAGDPDIILTTRAVDLCRLAANRLPFADLEADVAGDRTLLEPLLVGATAFAAD